MSKGRLFFIFISLAVTAAAISIYLNQSNQRSQKNIVGSAIKSKLKNYELYRYRQDQLIARATGAEATLFDQGRLVCGGGTRAVRMSPELRQEISSDTAEVIFQTENLFGQGAGMVDTILFSGNVDYIRGNSRFQTDWIKYTEKTGEAVSDRPVRIESDGQFIAAEGGMIYNAKTEDLRLKGGVFGSLRTDVMDKQLGGKAKK
jgi:LPS export ABC transporter protein LptC